MAQAAPGRSHRAGIGLKELMRIFPDENTARAWLEEQIWPDGPYCPHCVGRTASSAISPIRQ